jgi:glycosyltransferase involved in cell wall biosynthesis
LSVASSFDAVEPTDPGLQLSDGKYLLCVGRLNVRKNLAVTLRAALRSGVLSKDFPLVVVGELSGRITRLDDEFRSAIAAGTLRIVGSVTDTHLKWLYHHCALFACLSLDEGFGLPPVEAASVGCRVLASDIAVFRETVGPHATFVDAADVDAIADAIRDIVLRQPSARLTGYGPAHSWSDVCAAIRSELVSVSGSPRMRGPEPTARELAVSPPV